MKSINLRNMSLAELWLSLVVLGLSLVTMFTGVTGNHSAAPIATVSPQLLPIIIS
jgi:hypothetical protein